MSNDYMQISRKYEIKNNLRTEDAAFYTTRINLNYIYNLLPDFKKNVINILEPSVGCGNFLLPIFKKYCEYKNVNLYVNDINTSTLSMLKIMLKNIKIPNSFNIIYLNIDYLKYNPSIHFDLIAGNPPFLKLDNITSKHTGANNSFELFWKKSLPLSDYVIFISPKLLLNSPTYNFFRKFLEEKNITDIIDFGEEGFKDVKIETIAIKIDNRNRNCDIFINVHSITKNLFMKQQKSYIFNKLLPYWVIYRNEKFDKIYDKMKKDIFSINKNYELSNSKMSSESENSVWIIRSKNINIHKPELIKTSSQYDRYAKKDLVKSTKFYEYILSAKDNLFLIPTLTYYPRVFKTDKMQFVNNIISVNGSVLVAQLKDSNMVISDKDIQFFYSKEFREFYSIAFNYSTRTLNIDSNTIKFFGVMR